MQYHNKSLQIQQSLISPRSNASCTLSRRKQRALGIRLHRTWKTLLRELVTSGARRKRVEKTRIKSPLQKKKKYFQKGITIVSERLCATCKGLGQLGNDSCCSASLLCLGRHVASFMGSVDGIEILQTDRQVDHEENVKHKIIIIIKIKKITIITITIILIIILI